MMRQEIQALKAENHQLRLQMSGHRGSYSAAPPPASAPPSGQYPVDPYASPRTELPPLRSLGSVALPQAPEGMTGVQYEGSRPPSYRSDRP